MSAFAKRNITAEHFRPNTTPDVSTAFDPLGQIQVHMGIDVVEVPQTFDDLTAATAEFLIDFDPSDDVKVGDRLDFDPDTPTDPTSAVRHEVTAIRKFTGKRSDYAEADVERKELPD